MTDASAMAPEPDNPLDAEAGRWLARRDRGLTAPEQDAYLEWLRANPAHAEAIARLDRTWSKLDTLAHWRPEHAARPNPDLLAVATKRPRLVKFLVPVLALAAALVLGLYLFRAKPTPVSIVAAAPAAQEAAPGVRVIPPPERIPLNDGSTVELNRDGKIEVAFTSRERRVRLVRGEAHFNVAKNPGRPFVVEADDVAVRDLGTAFDILRRDGGVEVLVTEGKVQVERPGSDVTPLGRGERAIVRPGAATAISTPTPSDFDQALAWRGVMLEFAGRPLREIIAEFNLRNHRQVAIADADTAERRVDGMFRADNLEGFLRLLEKAGVAVDRRDDGSVVLHH